MLTSEPTISPLRARIAMFASSSWSIVLVGLAIRLAVVGFLYPDQMDPGQNHWHFAFENGKIADSILHGHGFANPLFENTGPTAWQPPVYPYLIAGVFLIFGAYTTASALVLLAFQSLVSALTCLPLAAVARQLFGDRVALFAGWAWALFPLGIYWPAERIWPTWLAGLLLTLLFWMTLRFERPASLGWWIGYGFLWGFAGLTDPVVLSVLPAMFGWIAYRLHQRHERWIRPLMVASLALALSVSPWFIRNYLVFHRIIPFRDSMGLEMWVGNNGDTSYWASYALSSALVQKIGPWRNEAELKELQRVGEIAYMKESGEKAMAFVRAHPRWFAVVTVRRIVFIWTHFWSFNPSYLAQEPDDPANIAFSTVFTLLTLVGLRRVFQENRSVAVLFALVFLFFPIVYYVSHVEVYYRRQIDPLMVLLSVYGLSSSLGWKVKTPVLAAAPGAALTD